MTAKDIHLIFPPQWSPFQPFLSTPSLKAYLRSKGFTVQQSDWNVEFYRYFIDQSRLPQAVDRLQRYVRELASKHENYRSHALLALGILKEFHAKRKLAERLRSPDCVAKVEDFYESVTAFKRLLHAFSVAEPVIEVGTSSLSTGNVMASMASIDRFCNSEDDNPFFGFFRAQIGALSEPPRYFGISIIGTEQILPLKFERYFEPKHYQGMFDIGFRSLYIGLESANERVQRHMKKNNTQKVMLSNLRDADAAGIWNHTFNFFGFPTETREEAMETAQFLIDHSDIIHSEGTGTFSFEHNAPISKHPDDFGVTNVVERGGNVLELYYDYQVSVGLTQEGAQGMVQAFKEMKRQHRAYQYGGWIPREHLLVLLGRHERNALRAELALLDSEIHAGVRWGADISWFAMENDSREDLRYFVINANAGTILETNRDAVLLLEFMPKDVPLEAVVRNFPALEPVLAH